MATPLLVSDRWQGPMLGLFNVVVRSNRVGQTNGAPLIVEQNRRRVRTPWISRENRPDVLEPFDHSKAQNVKTWSLRVSQDPPRCFLVACAVYV